MKMVSLTRDILELHSLWINTNTNIISKRIRQLILLEIYLRSTSILTNGMDPNVYEYDYHIRKCTDGSRGHH